MNRPDGFNETILQRVYNFFTDGISSSLSCSFPAEVTQNGLHLCKFLISFRKIFLIVLFSWLMWTLISSLLSHEIQYKYVYEGFASILNSIWGMICYKSNIYRKKVKKINPRLQATILSGREGIIELKNKLP